MRGAVGVAAVVLAVLACWLVGTATAQQGGISPEAAAERQHISLLRADWNNARARRCMNERRFWRNVRDIPRERLYPVRRWHQAHVRHLRRSSSPRFECGQSDRWAESWAGQCVSSKEGGLRSVSRPSGTYHGKWQMNRAFELAYAPGFAQQLGRASNWPEWLQDLGGWRGWQARGWWPWPNTARECGLL